MRSMPDKELVNAWVKRLENRKNDDVILFLGRKKITKKELIWNIENDTPLGRRLKEMAYNLAISMLEKGKGEVKDAPQHSPSDR